MAYDVKKDADKRSLPQSVNPYEATVAQPSSGTISPTSPTQPSAAPAPAPAAPTPEYRFQTQQERMPSAPQAAPPQRTGATATSVSASGPQRTGATATASMPPAPQRNAPTATPNQRVKDPINPYADLTFPNIRDGGADRLPNAEVQIAPAEGNFGTIDGGGPNDTLLRPDPLGGWTRFGDDTGPSATGFVNFDRYYNANSEVARRGAKARGEAAAKAGEDARKAHAAAMSAFGRAVNAGTNKGPTDQEKMRGAGLTRFDPNDRPSKNMDESGLTDEEIDSIIANGNNPNRPEADPDVLSMLGGGAGRGYGGPESLSATDDYDELLKQTVAAQDLAANPLTGLNSMDADLLGAAGRPRFADVEKRYGGLKDELAQANTASIAQAKAAEAASKTGQAAYSDLLKHYEGLKNAQGEAYDNMNKPSSSTPKEEPILGKDGGTISMNMGKEWDGSAGAGSAEAWDALTPEQRVNGFFHDSTYEEWTGSSNRTLDGILHGTFNVDPKDAAWIRGEMTRAEWDELQKAVGAGAGHVINWIIKMLRRKRSEESGK